MATQVEMAFESTADEAKRPARGGARKGAGRPPKGGRHDSPHATRPAVSKHEPRHVVLRTLPSVPRLRKGKVYHAIRKSLRRMLGELGFRVVHMTIQHNHLHFLVEANSKNALRRGMQALAISAAKQINRVCRRRGKVFAYRYHATAISSPRQARNALAYVLNNWRRHKEDETTLASRFAALDPYSTARQFPGWKEQDEAVMPHGFRSFSPLEVSEPRSWLLREGWRKHGAISLYLTPGPLSPPRR